MRVIRVFLSLLVVSSSFWALMLQSAGAQSADPGFNLITSPLPINLTAKPGTSVSADIKVQNGGTQTETLKVSLMKFSAYGEEGKPAIADRGPHDDYFDWVSFSPQVFDAPPNVWQTVHMTINLPSSAAFGYYYAAVFSRAHPITSTTSKQNNLIGSTAVLVLLDAKVPGAKRDAAVTSFTADKRFYEFLPSNFTVKIHNSGNVHLIPTGNIFITQGGKDIATLDINKSAGNVLPNSNRIFTATWADGFPSYQQKQQNGQVVLDKNDKPKTSLTWDFTKTSHLRFGHYTAHLVLAYDNGTQDVPMEAVVSFWVLPLRIIGAILLVILLVGAGLWSFVHKIYKKVPKKSSSPKEPDDVKKKS